jgi:uncharacterized repeat protein (TIGR03803 family)
VIKSFLLPRLHRRAGSGAAALAFVILIGDSALAAAQESVLYSFHGDGDGSRPDAALIADAKGVLYGTTFTGGDHGGTVFALSPPRAGQTRWTETVLYRFRGGRDGDGLWPHASLIADAKGVLYGTTVAGGYNSGTVFALSPPAQNGTQ